VAEQLNKASILGTIGLRVEQFGGASAVPTSGWSDEAIMLRVRDGEVGMLSELFERHHRQVFNYLYRLTASRQQAEDLMQDVFFRILKYRDTYRPRTSFVAWMYQVARNAQIDSRRKYRVETAWSEDAPEPASRERPADEQLRREQEVRLVRRALAALPPDKREVLVLSRYQNLKYEQIGEILGCEVNTVKQRVFRAVKALSDKYEELAGGQPA
jgi:RNA polymerase sigma factor (sigma-70 family)